MLFIGEVAKQAGINQKTIRFYEDIKLLPKSKQGQNNYRIYSQDTITRIYFIKNAKSLGFSLQDIKEILVLKDQGFEPCSHVRDLLKQRIIALKREIAELNALNRDLKKLEDEWGKKQPIEYDEDGGICPQIERAKVRVIKKPSKYFYPKK